MYRFLLTRRWVGFALLVAVLAVACVLLGRWQFHRLHDRRAENAVIEHNLSAPPVPASSVLAVGRPVPERTEWRRVTATGHYDVAHQLVVLYQTRNGAPGVDALTPLRTPAGPALLVDRGWFPSSNSGAAVPRVPPPPSSTVRVTGWVRADSTSTGSDVVPVHREVRAVSSGAIARTLPYPVLGGFLDLTGQRPPSSHPLRPATRPDLSDGPHLFYGIQWWFFAALALTGLVWFAYAEAHPERSRRGGGTRRDADTTEPETGEAEPDRPREGAR